MTKFIEFSSTTSLNEQLANQIVSRLQNSIEQKGKASIVISGGNTPQELFKLLSKRTLDWSNVYITLADERWVDITDKTSNERTVRENLLQNEAVKAHFISLKNPNQTPFEGAPEVEEKIKTMPVPFDIVILGMGDDGHTASLFPGAANLNPALDMNSGRICIGMTPLTAPYDRITLTLPALLNSRHIFVHIVGDNKRTVYEQAVSDGNVNEMPIRAVLNQSNVPVDVYWAG